MKNEYGADIDRNGYAPSIMQNDMTCFRCGKSSEKLDRHEPFGNANRDKSKRYGMWCYLCHDNCHLNGVHKDAAEAMRLKIKCQRIAMKTYGWSKEDFIREFGKNYL